MRQPDRPAGHEQAAMSTTARRHTQPGRFPATLAELLWSVLVMVVALGTGLAVNMTFGWWPGLAALLIAGVVIGAIAHRQDLRKRG